MTLPRRLLLLAAIAIAALLLAAWLAQGGISLYGAKTENPAGAGAVGVEDEAAKFEQEMNQAWIEKTREAYAKAQEYLQKDELTKAQIAAFRSLSGLVINAFNYSDHSGEVKLFKPWSPEGPGGYQYFVFFPEGEALRFFWLLDRDQIAYIEPLEGEQRLGLTWVALLEETEPFKAGTGNSMIDYLAATGRRVIEERGKRPDCTGQLIHYWDYPAVEATWRDVIPASPPPGYQPFGGTKVSPSKKYEVPNTWKRIPLGNGYRSESAI